MHGTYALCTAAEHVHVREEICRQSIHLWEHMSESESKRAMSESESKCVMSESESIRLVLHRNLWQEMFMSESEPHLKCRSLT